ncbi:MAG: LuxR C-terminal-related transcriptional regulator [Chloroflexota bacterium]
MLLSTKLEPPQISTFVIPRLRLFERLEQAAKGRLTLVTAPAGYGKSTLVAHWLALEIDHVETALPKAAWLLLDEYDDEPVRFMRYLIGAIQALVPDVGQTIQESLQLNPGTPLPQTTEDILTVLINELAATTAPMLLVLDDLHLVTNQRIIDGVQYWIEHAPAAIHTILISRDVSSLPVARWLVRGHCTEVTANDLGFTSDEAAQFVREMLRLDLTTEQITQLTTRTEGWIAGLQLAALSLQSTDDPEALIARFTGSERHVMDYLIGEVLQKQPEELRNFLLYTSILKRLSPELCNRVTGLDTSYEILEQLEKRNLFLVPLDNQRAWYRYHPLFGEAIQARLYGSQSQQVKELHIRAYEWFMENSLYEEAMAHAFKAELYIKAAHCLDKLSQQILWDESRSMAFVHWCNQLPEAVIYARPSLAISFGWAQLLSGQYDNLAELTQRMRSAWVQTDFDFESDPQIRTELAVLEAEVGLHLGQIAQVIQILERVDPDVELLNSSTQAVAQQLYGYAYRLDGKVQAAKTALYQSIRLSQQLRQKSVWLYAHTDLTETHTMAGELSEAEAVCRTVIQYNHLNPLSYPYLNLAHVLYLENRLVDATDAVQRGLALCTQYRWATQYGFMIQASIHYLQGKWEDVEQFIERIDQLSSPNLSPRRQARIETFKVRQYLLHDEPERASMWSATYRQHADAIPRYQLHTMDVTFGRYQLAVNPPAAMDTLQLLRTTAESEGWIESLIEINILLALVYQLESLSGLAQEALYRALTLSRPENIIAPFLVEGAKIVPLLRLAAKEEAHQSFVGQLQASFLQPTVNATPSPSQPLVEPLTRRELDVLKMMATGLSNPEIAEHLIIATGTVAKHTNNIFGKLEVRNRTEATQRAQELGLINRVSVNE